MSKLNRYLFILKQLHGDDLCDNVRAEYEEEIDELYYSLSSEETEYVMEKELEM